MADVIGEATGGDLFCIQTTEPYPSTFDALASQADYERQNNIYPDLAADIENFDDYDVVFVGYPIWWYQMPMPMYSFFGKYDFAGKTIIPFSSHGGSGWAGTVDAIVKMEADATIVEGYSISRNDVGSSKKEILKWLEQIGMLKK